MIPAEFISVLHIFTKSLKGKEVSWAITGSLGFALQGVPATPNDIDIQTDESGVYKITELLTDYVIQAPKLWESEHTRSIFASLRMNGVDVEVMGAIQRRSEDGSWEAPVDIEEHKRIVTRNGISLPVLDLHYEQQAYQMMGRNDKATYLAEWLKRQGIYGPKLEMKS